MYIGFMKHDSYLQAIDLSKPLPPAHSKVIVQFGSRREAERAAQSIGWSACDATEVDVMGFRIWTITDPHGNAVTRDGFIALGRR